MMFLAVASRCLPKLRIGPLARRSHPAVALQVALGPPPPLLLPHLPLHRLRHLCRPDGDTTLLFIALRLRSSSVRVSSLASFNSLLTRQV